MLNEKWRLSKRKTRFSLADVVFSNLVDLGWGRIEIPFDPHLLCLGISG